MLKVKLLTPREITKLKKQLSDWSFNAKNSVLTKTFSFPAHVDALIFIARITVHAEVLQHHPELVYSHCKVKVKLTTHEAKGLTKKDKALARRVDSLAGE